MSVVTFPGEYRRPPEVSAREKWDSPQPSDLMVWEVCVYTRGMAKASCQGCPEWEEGSRGKVKRGCRMWAEEACRTLMAVQRRETPTPSLSGRAR